MGAGGVVGQGQETSSNGLGNGGMSLPAFASQQETLPRSAPKQRLKYHDYNF